MCQIIDFKSSLKERDQKLIHGKVQRIISNINLLTTARQLKQHFREWIVLEEEKTKCKNQFTERFQQNKINYG
jgi:hypothetical protein